MLQRLFGKLLILWTTTTVACAAEFPVAYPIPSPSKQQADGLLVKFKSQINQQQARAIAESYGAREILSLSTPQQATPNSPMAQWHHLRFDRNVDLQQIMQRMAQDAGVETVELNEVVTIQK